ncbi:hypothetical protein HRG84_24280 [Flavisolibacter sp. BT320]|nr:hypothetical protein [Flavisolibacter longurius]
MTDFKTKFNYIVFGLRLLFFIFFVGLFFVFVFKAAPAFYNDNAFGVKLVAGLLAGFFLTTFLPYRFGKILLKERNDIIIQDGKLTLEDAITRKQRHIDKNQLLGFSTTVYETKAWNFKSMIFYFTDGDKIEFPQFLYWNFKDIKQMLIDNDIKYFGHEPYRWKWFDTRHYYFDKETAGNKVLPKSGLK